MRIERLRAWCRRRPRACDAVLAAACAGSGLPSVLPPHPRQVGAPVWLVLLAQLVLTVPLVWRRPFPLVVTAVVAGALAAHWLLPIGWLQGDVAAPVALYSVAVRRPRPQLLVACGMLAAATVVIAVHWAPADSQAALALLWLACVAAAAIGVAARFRRDYQAALIERAHRLEVERDQDLMLAAAAERSRIAREMHDIVAHGLAVMIGLADGASYSIRDTPDRAEEAVQKMATTGRQALRELRQLLGLLRTDEEGLSELHPVPGTADLDDLVRRVTAAGLPVLLRGAGPPDVLPRGVQLTVYRIVQESLTNALKHAGPDATATVRLRHIDDTVEIEVIDTGPGRTATAPSGRGIAGMAERAALHGGVVTAGPAPSGGWQVRTTLTVPPVDDS